MKLDLHSDQRLRLAKEMYLKAILQLSKEGEVKQTDLVECLNVSKSTVNEMVKKMTEEGLLEETLVVQLTKKGKKYASLVLKKYTILKEFLEEKLQMQDAHDEACNLEHACSLEMIEKLDEYVKK